LSYRNDHDAALSRIDALEQELRDASDAAREKSARDHQRIAMLEREIAQLKRGEEPAPSPMPVLAPANLVTSPKQVDVRVDDALPIPERGPAISIGLLVVLLTLAIAIAGGVLVLVRGTAKEPERCTLDTLDHPAELYAFDVNGARDLGPTPVTLKREEWLQYERFELRRDGYDTLGVVPPVNPNAGCTTKLWRMYPR